VPTSKSLNAYTDVTQLLDAALTRGGLRFSCASRNAAIGIKQKIYNYLTLYRKHEMLRLASIPAGQIAPTPYDNLIVKIDKEDPAILSIELRDLALLSQITILDGAPIVPKNHRFETETAAAPADDLEAAISALASRTQLDLE